MASQVTLKALGLNYSPNNLALPEGSLLVANNVIVRRDNVVESRRGFKDYSEGLGPTNEPIKQLIEYKERILAHYGTKIAYDTLELNSDGQNIFNDFSGSFSETQTGLRIKSIIANKNLYFTSSEGIKKLSAKSAEDFSSSQIVNAGAVKALDITANLDVSQGQLTGFLPVDSAVAYRVLWGYKDANENLIYGTPSERTLIYNYLQDIIPLDLNTLLNAIDNLNQPGLSMIDDGDYYDTYKLLISDTAEKFKTNVLGLAEKLDKDILYADLDTVPADAPLTIDSLQINVGSIGQINFPLTQDPTQYFQENDYIEIEGFNSEPVSTSIALTNVGGNGFGENPVTITTSPNTLVDGREVNITGTTTLQSINGTYEVDIIEKTIIDVDGGGILSSPTVIYGLGAQQNISSSTTNKKFGISIVNGNQTTPYTISSITNYSTFTGVSSQVIGAGPNYTIQITVPADAYTNSLSAGPTYDQINISGSNFTAILPNGNYYIKTNTLSGSNRLLTLSSDVAGPGGATFTTTSSTYNDAGFTIKTPDIIFTLAQNHGISTNDFIDIQGSTYAYGSPATVLTGNLQVNVLTANSFYIHVSRLLTVFGTLGTATECIKFKIDSVESGGTNLINNDLIKIVGVTSTPSLNFISDIDDSLELYVNTLSGTAVNDTFYVSYTSGGQKVATVNANIATSASLYKFITITTSAGSYTGLDGKLVELSGITNGVPSAALNGTYRIYSASGSTFKILPEIHVTTGVSLTGVVRQCTQFQTAVNHGLSNADAIFVQTNPPSTFSSTPVISGKHYVQEVTNNTFYISVANTPTIDLVTTTAVTTNTPVIFKRMTIETSQAHGFNQNNFITISNSTIPEGIDGAWQIEKIVSSTEFTILPTTSNSYTPTSGVDIGQVNRITIPVFVDSVTIGTGTVKSTVGKNLKQFNGNWQITEVVAPTGVTPSDTKGYIRFIIPNNPDTFSAQTPDAITDSGAKIYSYDYRKIVNSSDIYYAITLNDLEISPIATSEQLRIIQNNISRIANKLKTENTAVISSTLIDKYLKNYSVTINANVKLQITVPEGIDENYFYQIYRTRLFTAEGIQTLGSLGDVPLIPDDEMRLVYESFPSIPFPVTIDVTDSYPEDLAATNENLYTNPLTGQGILQANDVPPFAKDINTFKYSTFYANTKTRQRLNPFQLIGTSIIDSPNNNKLTIGDENGSITYLFTPGVQQSVYIKIDSSSSAATIETNISNKYIEIYTPVNSYYMWFNYDGNGTDPAPANKKRITVNLLTGDTANDVATLINNALGAEAIDFSSSNTLKINNISSVLTVTTITTSVNHGLLNGDSVVISGVTQDSGTTPINGTFTISSVTPNTFQISTPITPTGVNFTSGSISTTKVNVINFDEGSCSSPTIGTTTTVLSVGINQIGDGEDALSTPYPKVLLSQVDSRSQAIDITSRSLVRVINKQPTSPVYAYYLSGEDSSPGIMNLEARDLLSPTFYVLASGDDIGSSFTPDISPEKIITSITAGVGNEYVITCLSHGLENQDKIIISGSNSNPNIDGIYSVTKISNTQFKVTGSSPFIGPLPGTYGSFTKLTNAIVSSNEEKKNRVYYSKSSQPEAVPLLNFFDVGSSDKAILRIFPLRDSLFVFKEDGLYRISGEEIPFVVGLFDSSCIVSAPDSVSVSNNVVYAWTVKGISNITESGVAEISRPIDTEILKISSSRYSNFKTLTWGIGYDSDNSYTVFTNSESTDEDATIGFRYSDLTNTWTNVVRSQNCGIVFSGDNKLYTAGSADNIIYQERKNFDRTDYSDSDFNLFIQSGDISNITNKPTGSRIFFTSVLGITDGDIITQEQILTHYLFNSLLEKLDLDPGIASNNYVQTLSANNGDNLRIKLLDLAAKLDLDTGLILTNYYSKIQNQSGAILLNTAANPTVITTASAHGLVDGRLVTITGTPNPLLPISNPSLVNKTLPVTVVTPTTFSVPVNVITAGNDGLSYSTTPNELDMLDLKACFNAIIENLNSDPGTAYKNYKPISNTNLLEAVITNVSTKFNYIDVNLPLSWIPGKVTIYKSIPCELIYAPITFEDPLSIKQIYEATMMFDNKAFTKATASFSTDLKPQFLSVDFYGQGNGIFGHYSNPGFGYGFFGGLSNSAPFRTIIPREAQRGRFLTVKFDHSIGREKWALNGITLTGKMGISSRGYR